MITRILPWQDPLFMANFIPEDEPCWVLLYSGMDVEFSGRYSLLALGAEQHVKSDGFEEFSAVLGNNHSRYAKSWFGYLGYELKNQLEVLPEDRPSFITLPYLWMIQYRLVLVFDHKTQVMAAYAKREEDFARIPQVFIHNTSTSPQVCVTSLQSNMSKAAYLEKSLAIKEAINQGSLYQANLTRKFFGTLESSERPIDMFRRLTHISPAPYSAFLKLEDTVIISSSPERFITIDAEGVMDTRPIKGSAARFPDRNLDAHSKELLRHSEKDRAENLMIVDLMRNDFSRSCETGSVRTPSLFDVTTYATVHHMASTVVGTKRKETSTLEAVKACFPPGSMTGAPKIKAMQLCSQLEQQQRGVYSGAIGWFGGDGSCDLSVVIRTLVMQGNEWEFQVGGAIVADSDPVKEWEETLLKARALAAMLGIKMEELEAL